MIKKKEVETMSEFQNINTISATDQGLRAYILSVFRRMGMGLLITAGTAYAGYRSMLAGGIMFKIIMNYYMPFTIFTVIAQLGICFYLSSKLMELQSDMATMLFYSYAFITGLTFSFLPLTFGAVTVFSAFLFASIMFGCCLVIGYTTDKDLTQYGSLLMAGLLALLVTTLLSIFIPIFRESMVLNYAGVILFLALTAYDM